MKHRANLIVILAIASRLLLAGTPVFAESAAKSDTITVETLLDDLVNLQRLTQLPEQSYTTKQFSSYDRKSTSPAGPKYANADCGQFLRDEDKGDRKEHVMADMDGPGVIVRIWSANPVGVLRVYLDGRPQPVIEAPMTALLGGTVVGMPVPLAGERSKGWNLYLPIPYAMHCKVTCDEGGFYYHVNYRTYAAGTKVVSFTMANLLQARHKVFDVAARLLSPRKDVAPPENRSSKPFTAVLKPGDEQALFEDSVGLLGGAKAICDFVAHIAADDLEAAARSIVVYMTFDGEKTVECPLGDFFGTAPGLTPFESLPLGITEDSRPELWSHWYMPFAKNCRISVKNLGNQQVQLDGTVATVPFKWDDRTMHFHAGWRQQKKLPTLPLTDWAHLDCTGTGRFVGGTLHIQNPVRGWWGEGDEKIYVDGEAVPSHFGTGTEDYYGYAWCSPARFVHAFHNQPRCDGPSNYGNTSLNRFHIIDDIPFAKQFKFDIENWHINGNTYTNRAAASFWYARPGCKDFFQPITKEDVKLEVMPELKLHVVQDAQEGERLKVVDKTTGKVQRQDLSGIEGEWSDMRQMLWTGAKAGDKLTLTFSSPEAGAKDVVVAMTKAKDYGIVQLHINGVKVGKPIDLYNASVAPTGPIDLGKVELLKGDNKLMLEIVGANEAAAGSYLVGLDYVLVK